MLNVWWKNHTKAGIRTNHSEGGKRKMGCMGTEDRTTSSGSARKHHFHVVDRTEEKAPSGKNPNHSFPEQLPLYQQCKTCLQLKKSRAITYRLEGNVSDKPWNVYRNHRGTEPGCIKKAEKYPSIICFFQGHLWFSQPRTSSTTCNMGRNFCESATIG